MEGQEPGERHFLDRFSIKNLWRAALVALLALTAGFGGLDAVSPATPMSLDKTYSNGPLRITPQRLARICGWENRQFDPSFNATIRTRTRDRTIEMIALQTTVENTTDIPVGLNQFNHSLNGLRWHTDPDFYSDLISLDTGDTEYFSQGTVNRDGIMESVPAGARITVWAVFGFHANQLAQGDMMTVRFYDFVYEQPLRVPLREWTPDRKNRSYGELRTALTGCLS